MSEIKTGRIDDLMGKISPLIIIQHDENQGEDPHVSIQAEGGFDSLTIFIESNPIGNHQMDVIEIGGVLGTIEQWRKVLLPILGIPYDK